jgi:hypothetical protein
VKNRLRTERNIQSTHSSVPRVADSYEIRLLLGLLGIRREMINYESKATVHTPRTLCGVNPDGKTPVPEVEVRIMLPYYSALLLYPSWLTDSYS